MKPYDVKTASKKKVQCLNSSQELQQQKGSTIIELRPYFDLEV
jgi:hypothetical protein